MLNAFYEPKVPSTPPDVYAAFYNFVLAYGLPRLPAANIYRGWQNRSALPPGSNEYAVISILGTNRRGTTVDELVIQGVPPDQGELYQLRTMYEAVVQVDLCSETDLARQRSYSLETSFRSMLGTNFFSKYGITAQYCSPIREMSNVDGSDQFVRRYSIDFNIEYWAGVDVDSAWFNQVVIQRLENVDAHHPPKEEAPL